MYIKKQGFQDQNVLGAMSGVPQIKGSIRDAAMVTSAGVKQVKMTDSDSIDGLDSGKIWPCKYEEMDN